MFIIINYITEDFATNIGEKTVLRLIMNFCYLLKILRFYGSALTFATLDAKRIKRKVFCKGKLLEPCKVLIHSQKKGQISNGIYIY